MTIYTSEKVMPYVYMGIHKSTGEFYIGSRTGTKQTLPSHLDIHHYRTSSKKVKPIFDEFDWCVLAEFFDPISAYTFEQELIYTHWHSPLKLNRRHTHGGGAWCVTGKERSLKHRQKLAAGRKGKRMSGDAKQQISEAMRDRLVSDETRAKISTAKRGRTLSQETIMKREATKGTRTYTKRTITQQHKDAIRDAMSENWTCISPDGKVFVVTNMRHFCKNHNLQPSRMSLVASGKCPHHKGWTCRRLL